MDARSDTQARRARSAPARALGLVLVASSLGSVGYALARQRAGTPPDDAALCHGYSGLPAGFGKDLHAGMVLVRGGSFLQGSTAGYADERPVRTQRVGSFWIDRTEVTHAQFAAFVAATGHVTTAERAHGAAVFFVPTESELAQERYAFWRATPGADYRHPEGPSSQIAGRENQPVVQVSWSDAQAYAAWLGHELPSEAEWEYAARAGRDDDTLHKAPRDAQGRALANYWQGDFPLHNSQQDGFATQAPVGCFAPNPFGLYDTIGNVWEWTSDRYTEHRALATVGSNPVDCHAAAAADEAAEAAGTHAAGARDTRVLKGGSFLCAPNFCARYRVSARHPQETDMPAQHIGFRTIDRTP